jgi:hypothetical protein
MHFYGSRISAHIAKLNDGGVLCQGVAIARTGDQEYLPSELADFAGTPPEGLKTSGQDSDVLSTSKGLFIRETRRLDALTAR